MANPLVRLGVKAAVKGGKKLAKKIKTRANIINLTNRHYEKYRPKIIQ